MYDPTKPYKKQILDLISQTWSNSYLFVKKDIYPTFERKFDYPEVDHTDGIGAKGIYHYKKRTFKNAVLDVLAMNLNDLALMRAVPYRLQNHILICEDDREAIVEIVQSLVYECKKRKITMTGGETSIHNNMDGLDISITVSGFIKKMKPNKFKKGDILIGLKSNGLHSNGFTKVREIYKDYFKPDFVQPTKIYIDTILALDEKFNIHGMMHITGGAYTKLKDLLKDTDVLIRNNRKLQPQSIFKDLYKKGISDEEMYKTFNCGIGFIFSVSKSDAEKIIREIKDADLIGEVVSGSGKVKIKSAFSQDRVEF